MATEAEQRAALKRARTAQTKFTKAAERYEAASTIRNFFVLCALAADVRQVDVAEAIGVTQAKVSDIAKRYDIEKLRAAVEADG